MYEMQLYSQQILYGWLSFAECRSSKALCHYFLRKGFVREVLRLEQSSFALVADVTDKYFDKHL